MRYYFTLLFICITLGLHANNWIVEAEGDAVLSWSKDSVADIHAPGGLTLWNTQPLSGDGVIEYEARIMSDGRVSDLNCFWMASDPNAKDVFVNIKRRGGKFVNSYTLQLYYMGYGGNYNKTTRFRRYDGDSRGVTEVKYRPAILREYLDDKHLIKGDHWYKIRLENIDGHVRYIIDGECLVDYVDPHPLTHGYFGFRTTLAHAQFRNYKATVLPKAKDITIHPVIDSNTTAIKRAIPTTFGVPFAQGELLPSSSLSVKTANGNALASDQWTLATWPDGSVKWQAIATVSPDSSPLSLSITNRTTKERKSNKAKEDATPDILNRLSFEQNGMTLPINSITHEQQGQVRNTWRLDGENFTARLYTYNGSNEAKLVFTHFIDSTTNANGLSSLAVKLRVPLHDALHKRFVRFSSKHNLAVKPLIARRPIDMDSNGNAANKISQTILDNIAAWDGFRLSQLSPNAYSIRKRATSISPWIGTLEGQRSPGIIAIGDTKCSTGIHLTDFWQSYPSTLQVDGMRSDTATVSIYLWSQEAEAMNFAHYDTIPHGLDAAYEDIQPGMSTANGISRTSTLYIYTINESIDSIATLIPSLSEHPQYLPTPEYLHRKRAFGYWSLDKGTALDSLLSDINRFYIQQQEEHGWYGYFNYGDVMHSYDTSRGEWRYDVGGYAWDNTELGTPAMLWYQFLRTGDSNAYRMAVAMTRHCAEVDCYHREPHAGLGTRHNVLHWGCGAKEARISEAFWNRFMYYLTADERMGDIMREVVDADQLLYHLDPMRLAQPRSEKYPCTAPARLRIGPDWLAYAGNWFTEWERTGNTKYRDKILAGMNSITKLPHGIFSGPKALGYDPATGIITWEGDSTVQNTNHLLTIMGGFEMMNEMMLSITTPEWNKTWLQHAVEYKEKALSISKNKFRIPRLQGYGYWHTGNTELHKVAYHDLMQNNPFRMLQGAESMNTIPMGRGGFYTNDAATFTLDAIFLQEVANPIR
ncbi:MAG: hypothetical protein KBT34_08440 [Prevotella sp.]|nr:hypothetical protein [Candidatus Prevotella equi]